jgi:hypothetical protein
MGALDETWTSWMRDLRLGKARLIVPQSMLETDGPGTGGMFDLDKEVRRSEHAGRRVGKDAITEVQFNIRVEEHERPVRRCVCRSSRPPGYSAQSSGEAGTVAATATEVVAARRSR